MKKKSLSFMMAMVLCLVLLNPIKSEASSRSLSYWSVVYSSGGICQDEYNSSVYVSGGGYAAKCTGYTYNGNSSHVEITMPGYLLNKYVGFTQSTGNEISFNTISTPVTSSISYRAKLYFSSDTTSATAAGYVRGK